MYNNMAYLSAPFYALLLQYLFYVRWLLGSPGALGFEFESTLVDTRGNSNSYLVRSRSTQDGCYLGP